jgi:hypothetical protein
MRGQTLLKSESRSWRNGPIFAVVAKEKSFGWLDKILKLIINFSIEGVSQRSWSVARKAFDALRFSSQFLKVP